MYQTYNGLYNKKMNFPKYEYEKIDYPFVQPVIEVRQLVHPVIEVRQFMHLVIEV